MPTLITKAWFVLCLLILLAACGLNNNATVANDSSNSGKQKQISSELASAMKAVEPFFVPMGKPKPGDWLASHPESGQTFEQYINSTPNVPTPERRTIYIMPLGKFTANQMEIIAKTSEYMQAFFGLSIETMSQRALPTAIASGDSRMNGYPQRRQIRTGYIMDKILKPAIPNDAAALIAFTNEDLFPDVSMNYVFGQASLEDRVGVWSLARLDDGGNQMTFLKRTLRVAVHETAHMFGFKHCTKYECVMSGTNSLAETDSRPIDTCPECMAKICWMTGTKPEERYERLAAFCQKYGLGKEADEFTRKASAVRN
jgi:archaemetzincin